MTAEPEVNEFSIMEKEDEQQIISADEALKQALVYKVNGKIEITYIGLKHLVLMMSQKQQPLSIVEHKMELLGEGNDRIWYATIKVRNLKTGYESVGMSEQPYFFNGKYDNFGRTKAFSKAERNAWRKQIPEFELKKLIQDATSTGQVKEIVCECTGGINLKDMSKNICLTCKKPLKK